MFRIAALSCGISAVALAGPALAGDEPLYDAQPAWVQPVDLAPALETVGPIVLLDSQTRLEDGVVSAYSDVALRIESPESLTQLGTIKLGWMPDKGDLIIHRLEIVRDAETIDLLGEGVRYEVLRRETQLEKRSLDGALTATLAVPQLKIGDVLRYAQTITKRDQALEGEVQHSSGVLTEPTKAGFSRMAISWPEGDDIRFGTTGQMPVIEPVTRGGYTWLEADVLIPEPEEMPDDAPGRFRMPPLVHVTSFADWRDVSRVMAPHFATEGTIAPGGPIAARIAQIEQATDDPLRRAALALQVVQDDVSYLLNGLNGGNYLPQSPAETWDKRYGDCKAKSLLLLAMLREMDIDADAVLVHNSRGDMVQAMLPIPGAFDHMIVRAQIDGTDYWLDGTTSNTRYAIIDEIGDWKFALPLTPGGADLVELEQRWPANRDRVAKVRYDYSAGLDLPALYEADIIVRNTLATTLQNAMTEGDAKRRIEYATEYLKNIAGDGVVYSSEITYDQEAGTARMVARGLISSEFEFERGKATLNPSGYTMGFDFEPDRARKAWRDIPVAVNGPAGWEYDTEYLLPGDADGYELTGKLEADETIAGNRLIRQASLDGNQLKLRDVRILLPAEIAPSAIAEERQKAARFSSADPELTLDAGVTRWWQHDPKTSDRRRADQEAAYQAVIDIDPEDAWRWAMRAGLRRDSGDLEGALADYSEAADLDATAERLSDRGNVLREMGDYAPALVDLQAAYDLDPTASRAKSIAHTLRKLDRTEEALAFLVDMRMSGDDARDLAQTQAFLMGSLGRHEDGLAIYDAQLLERPGDGDLMNEKCWYQAVWNTGLDTIADVCDEAVEADDYSASALDSRGLANFRLGKLKAAKSDFEAALLRMPDQSGSIFMRGLIRIEMGDEGGLADLQEAGRLYAGVADRYADYGIEAP